MEPIATNGGAGIAERANVGDIDTGDFGPVETVERNCPLCGLDNRATPPNRYSNEPWTIKTCAGCGFVYIDRAPGYTALFSTMAWERTAKAEERRREAIRPLSFKYSRLTRARLHILPRKKMHALVEAHAKPGNVVDLGCGDGSFMAELADRFVPFGIEISTALAGSASERFGARGGGVINAPCLDGLKGYADGFFSAATLRSYLEHEMHPAAVLKELHRALAPGGVAVVKVPNYASLNRRVMGRKWCGFRYPDHLNYFTPATLAAMAETCGYRARFGLTYRLPTSDNMYAILARA